MKITSRLSLRVLARLTLAASVFGAPLSWAPVADASMPTARGIPGASIEVTWKASATTADKAAFETALASANRVATPRITDPGPSHPVLYCSYGNYVFRDSSGNMVMRYNCPYRNINWAWTMSPTLLAISAGLCDERGMVYTVNGLSRPMNSPHPGTPCNYIFHGTLSGVYNADTVAYADDYYFPVKGGGTAHVHVFGTVIASNY